MEIAVAETDTMQDMGEIMMTTLILTAADGATTATTRTPLAYNRSSDCHNHSPYGHGYHYGDESGHGRYSNNPILQPP
jgi:hypothetical protein